MECSVNGGGRICPVNPEITKAGMALNAIPAFGIVNIPLSFYRAVRIDLACIRYFSTGLPEGSKTAFILLATKR